MNSQRLILESNLLIRERVINFYFLSRYDIRWEKLIPQQIRELNIGGVQTAVRFFIQDPKRVLGGDFHLSHVVADPQSDRFILKSDEDQQTILDQNRHFLT